MQKLIELYKQHARSFLVILLLVSMAAFNVIEYQKNTKLKQELALVNQNYSALNDSLRVTITKVGKAEYDRVMFVSTLSYLNKLNDSLATAVKETAGKVATIGQASVIIKHDTLPGKVTVKTVIIHDDTAEITSLNLDTVYSNGNFSHIGADITYIPGKGIHVGKFTNFSEGFNITTGIKNIHSKPEIFLRSEHPGFVVTELKGAILDPSLFKPPPPPRFQIGIQIGFAPVTYGLTDKAFDFTPRVYGGIGINYRIF